MLHAVYNSAIPNVFTSLVDRVLRSARSFRIVVPLSYLLLGMAFAAHAADWSGPEQQLARKIVAVTGPGAVTLTAENHSSLGKRDSEVIQNGLRSALGGLGIRFVNAEQAAATVVLSLSENQSSYVWVAQIRQGAGEAVVVMVSAPRPEGSTATHETVPLSLRKEKVTLYRWQSGKWQQEQALGIVHARPWPRDLRGRLVPAKDHLFDAYLPGVVCRLAAGAPLTLNCRETDDPWPLVAAGLSGGNFSGFPGAGSTSTSVSPLGAFYASTRNFFTGVLTPGISKSTTVPKFYSAAFLPRDKYLLWLFASTDGHVRMVDGVSDQVARLDWGELASVKTACGAGWQVLAASSEGTGDSVHTYEFPDRDPVAVTAAIDFQGGAITALWTEAKGDTAIAIVRNRETRSYEAFRLAVVCSQ